MITIINYGVGNLASVQNMLKKCGVESKIASDPESINKAAKLILPGVGAFDAAMQKITELGIDQSIAEASQKGSFILGICLGSQLLFEGSDEGVLRGLSLIKGKCRKFNAEKITPLRVPHMGWSDVAFRNTTHPLADFDVQPRFYFAHSFYFEPEHQEDILAACTYGHSFTCVVARNNIMGVQFHPEKSHVFGARLLTNFGKM